MRKLLLLGLILSPLVWMVTMLVPALPMYKGGQLFALLPIAVAYTDGAGGLGWVIAAHVLGSFAISCGVMAMLRAVRRRRARVAPGLPR